MLAILLQARGSGLSATFGGDSLCTAAGADRATPVAVHDPSGGPVPLLLRSSFVKFDLAVDRAGGALLGGDGSRRGPLG